MLGLILLVVLALNDTLMLDLETAKQMALEGNILYNATKLEHSYYGLDLYGEMSSNILNPSISVTYSDATYEQFPTFSEKGYNFSLSMEQPVLDIGEAASVLQSKSNYDASTASLEEAKNALFYQVEAYYLGVLKTEKLLLMREMAIKRAEENMRFVSKRLELGQASKLDSLNAEVYLNRSKLNLTSAKKDYQIAKRLLLDYLGYGYQCELILQPVEIEDEHEPLDVDSLISLSLEVRPKIKAVEKELSNAQLGFWGSTLSFLPRLSFKWLWNYNTENFPDDFSTITDEATKTSGWYASATMNLFTYPLDVAKMKNILEKTRLNLLNERILVIKEVKEAWLDFVTMSENLNLARSLYEAADEGNKIAKLQYNLGMISTLELFQAENDFLDAEVTHVSAQYDYRLSRAKLRYVVGE